LIVQVVQKYFAELLVDVFILNIFFNLDLNFCIVLLLKHK